MRTYLRVNSGENAPITYTCVFTWKKAWINYTSHASQYVCILFLFNLSEMNASSCFWIFLVKTEYAISWFHPVWELTQEWIMERMHRLPILVYLLGKEHGNNIHLMRLNTCVSSFLYIQSLWKVCFFLILDYSGKNLVCHQLISSSMRTYLRVSKGENAPITDSCLFTWNEAWKKIYNWCVSVRV